MTAVYQCLQQLASFRTAVRRYWNDYSTVNKSFFLNILEFLSFQDLLQQENLPVFVFSLCEHDPKSFVRASALKCLQQMIQSSVLWNKFFSAKKLLVESCRAINFIFIYGAVLGPDSENFQ